MNKTTIIRRIGAIAPLFSSGNNFLPLFLDSASATFTGRSDYHSLKLLNTISKKPRYYRREIPICHSSKGNFSTANTSPEGTDLATTFSEKLSDKNFAFYYEKYCNRLAAWELYLGLLDLLLLQLEEELVDNPGNKRIAIELKKLKRSFADSYCAYTDFYKIAFPSYENLPTEPAFYKPNIKSIISKKAEKLKRKEIDKKITVKRKQARKNKWIEQNFWVDLYEYSVSLEKEVFEDDCDYNKFAQARAELLKAEKLMQSPCVSEAAWIIHDALLANDVDSIIENAETIKKANEILKNYQTALDKYSDFIGDSAY